MAGYKTTGKKKSITVFWRRRLLIGNNTSAQTKYKQAIADGYKRLLKPSMETEVHLLTKKKADEEAIRVFAENARQLAVRRSARAKTCTMAIDPGFRTGCKVACLDEQGKLLEVYRHIIRIQALVRLQSRQKKLLNTFIREAYNIEAIAIGNGTAGRETEAVSSVTLNLPDALLS